MARKHRTHVPGEGAKETRLTPKHLTRQQFSKRLYDLMVSRHWTQSELARQAGLPRDSISTYIRGKSFPSPLSLQKLADAFGLEPDELLPNTIESAIDADNPAFEMKVSTNRPDLAWVRLNQLVSTSTAMKIVALLEEDDAADRVRSGRAPALQPDED